MARAARWAPTAGVLADEARRSAVAAPVPMSHPSRRPARRRRDVVEGIAAPATIANATDARARGETRPPRRWRVSRASPSVAPFRPFQCPRISAARPGPDNGNASVFSGCFLFPALNDYFREGAVRGQASARATHAFASPFHASMGGGLQCCGRRVPWRSTVLVHGSAAATAAPASAKEGAAHGEGLRGGRRGERLVGRRRVRHRRRVGHRSSC